MTIDAERESERASGPARTGLAKLRGDPAPPPVTDLLVVEPARDQPPATVVSLVKVPPAGRRRRLSGRVFAAAIALVVAIAVLLTFVLR